MLFSYRLPLLASLLALAGCTVPITKPAAPAVAEALVAAPEVDTNFDADRAAILAMAGQFRVTFAFHETVALAPSYIVHAPENSKATEWVNVIEDRGDFIALQHILVVGDEHHVVKHWRQDWKYQPATLQVFRGESRWERVAVDATARRGAWSQTVYHVDDSPRYAGLGHWNHANGTVAWTSNETWRPLPRCEYTTRGDYQVLDVTNRHRITPTGWVHEQDNTKHVLKPDGSTQPLAKEFGLNTYTRIGDADYDFSAGREYWSRTQPFWSEVRKAWDSRLAHGAPMLALREKVDEEDLFERMFALANAKTFDSETSRADVSGLMQQYERMP